MLKNAFIGLVKKSRRNYQLQLEKNQKELYMLEIEVFPVCIELRKLGFCLLRKKDLVSLSEKTFCSHLSQNSPEPSRLLKIDHCSFDTRKTEIRASTPPDDQRFEVREEQPVSTQSNLDGSSLVQ
jgi:hypothetical protein